jgi:alpha-amylase/alpha-mannosidase (GH57 family)
MYNICIHGHFYQPPRENPWTGEIELQESASPFHNWNERIWNECYAPNSEAEILDDKGNVIQKVNNYEMMNFNFGPTLLEWIKRKHYGTYVKIIEADKNSQLKQNGHGNAIAMCYNHMIMPLALRMDKITQVKWGVADFRHHFNREPEGIWLPETACDEETLEVLISENIRYTILDVSQAQKIRKIGEDEWLDISDNKLNPRIPYRYYSVNKPDRFIDIIFYDGYLSRAVAFDDVLLSSENLLFKIINAGESVKMKGELISIATDGETFGHHKKHAEKTLAYFFKILAAKYNLQITNFGKYLSDHKPEFEVKIKPGGTSWSCIHGVERWKSDCGCGKTGKWNQKWRTPLRESLNWLRDQLWNIYVDYGSVVFRDIYKARDNYISVILNGHDTTSVKEFLKLHSVKSLTKKQKLLCLDLLEMQKYSMLMFTSCGWFFSELSGIETVQILQYAARAIEIIKSISGEDLEKEFMNRLASAQSNIPEFANGKNVYERFVMPAKIIGGKK